MQRRSFLQALVGLGIAASAGILRCCTKIQTKTCCLSPEMMEDIKNWDVDKTDEQTKKEILGNDACVKKVNGVSEKQAEPPKPTEPVKPVKPVKNLNENRYYKPHWNVSGSWSRAESRSALISHLSGSNHGHDRSYLNTLSTDELQMLHDNDHDSRSSRTWRWRR